MLQGRPHSQLVWELSGNDLELVWASNANSGHPAGSPGCCRGVPIPNLSGSCLGMVWNLSGPRAQILDILRSRLDAAGASPFPTCLEFVREWSGTCLGLDCKVWISSGVAWMPQGLRPHSQLFWVCLGMVWNSFGPRTQILDILRGRLDAAGASPCPTWLGVV